MTKLLDDAVALLRQLPDEEQDFIAAMVLAELSSADDFDAHIAATADQLLERSHTALREHRNGLTHELIPDRL